MLAIAIVQKLFLIALKQIGRRQRKQSWNWYEWTTVRPSLFKSMTKSFGLPFCLAAVLKLIHDICQFVGPIMLSKITDFLESTDPNIPKVDSIYYIYL